MNDPYKKYKDLYRDLIFGFSEFRFESNKEKVFIKHLNDLETGETERNYKEHLYLAREKGLKTEEESIKFLIEESIWSEKKEKRIEELKDKLVNLEATKSKLLVKAQVSSLEKEIKPIYNELQILMHERQENIGMTAEAFANKKISESTIQSCFYKDRNLKELYFTEEEFDYLEHGEVNECLSIYTEMIAERFGGDEIKKVAACPFFMNVYVLCEDNPYNFFGRPILTLTNFQVSLMSHAKYLKSLMSNHKSPPDDYQGSPQKVIEWYELQVRSSEAKSNMETKGDGGGRSIFGATKEELSSIETDDEKTMSLNNQIEQHGGEMNFDEILKMHGL